MGLRKRLIRLAYESPELREDLLPLLKEAVNLTPLYAIPQKSRPRYVGTLEFLQQMQHEYQYAVPKAYGMVGQTLKDLQKDWGTDLSKEVSDFEQIAKLGKQAGDQYEAVLQAIYKMSEDASRAKQAFNPVLLGMAALMAAAKALTKALKYGKGTLSARAVESFLARSESILDDNIESQKATLLSVFDRYPDLKKKLEKAISTQKTILGKIQNLQQSLPGKLAAAVVY